MQDRSLPLPPKLQGLVPSLYILQRNKAFHFKTERGNDDRQKASHRTQSEETCDVLLPTSETPHVVVKGHKPLAKTHVWTLENKRPILTVVHIYTHTRIHMYVSKVNFYPLYFGQLWTH